MEARIDHWSTAHSIHSKTIRQGVQETAVFNWVLILSDKMLV